MCRKVNVKLVFVWYIFWDKNATPSRSIYTVLLYCMILCYTKYVPVNSRLINECSKTVLKTFVSCTYKVFEMEALNASLLVLIHK